jgi:hypothetical protein
LAFEKGVLTFENRVLAFEDGVENRVLAFESYAPESNVFIRYLRDDVDILLCYRYKSC